VIDGEGNERFDADRCVQFNRKIGDHFAEDTVVVDCVLHGQALTKNGGAMDRGGLRDRIVRDLPASPCKEESVPNLVQDSGSPSVSPSSICSGALLGPTSFRARRRISCRFAMRNS